ncbi:MAG: alanine--tRNA ligase-related protein, partial [Bacilli bacterium]|nr:alanine--tRNA ligase-related protein [Bacilli bacterium]
MKKLTSNDIRNLYQNYFKDKDHIIVPSESLIPVDDPTLLWINSGVATMKQYFDGSVIPLNKRIVKIQRCIRTNDIDNVGETAIHHTFFEMMGNFSIGDYFKKEAIEYCYEFLTSPKWLGLNKDKLYITVYPADKESYNIWLSL